MRRWGRWLGLSLSVVVILLAALYAGDFLLLRFRVSRGTAYSTVEVHQFLATPLKGNKVEYDLMGTFEQRCSRSIFPQMGNSACWWLRRHSAQWE